MDMCFSNWKTNNNILLYLTELQNFTVVIQFVRVSLLVCLFVTYLFVFIKPIEARKYDNWRWAFTDSIVKKNPADLCTAGK